MSLKDIDLKGEYRTLKDNVSVEFYIPLLSNANSYKRAVGYFSSTSLVEIVKGISGLIENGGTIQLVASPKLSEADVEAIDKGYELRDEIIEKNLMMELKEVNDEFDRKRLNLLASLIAKGILEIKIALLVKGNNYGMFHEKLGIIGDSDGNKVAFSGSMNETITAQKINYDSFDVFRSWSQSEEIRDKVISKSNVFKRIWNGTEEGIITKKYPNVDKAIIQKYKVYDTEIKEQCDDLYEIDNQKSKKIMIGSRVNEKIRLYEYQENAITEWVEHKYKGIYDMATGTGKTFTGLASVARISEDLDDKLAVIIVCPYQHLVEQWVEDMENFNIKPIVGYSSSSQKDWRIRLSRAVRNQKIGGNRHKFFTLICTNATFKSDFVQVEIGKIKSDILLVVDEAHNFGAYGLRKFLDNRFKYRLALSATFERHNDEEGTEALKNYFGEKCIEYTLSQAIKENKLTEYRYYPRIVSLTDEERDTYNELTYELSKNLKKTKSGKIKMTEYGKMIALKRARLIASAEGKIIALYNEIKNYSDDTHILVYCGSARMNEEYDDDFVDDSEMRQIDVVTSMLNRKLDMNVSQFTSKENVDERKILKEQFSSGETLQALIAIKCLDEGVNIPKIKTAFILASTTNPKEYIQRRGRVLRKSKGKEVAEIFDFVTLPRPLDEIMSLSYEELKKEIGLVKNEINRIEEFCRISKNKIEGYDLVWKLKDAYKIDTMESAGDDEWNYC